MESSPLAPWRDLALVWFILWAFIFTLIPGAAFYFAVVGMRRFNRWIRLPLLQAQVWALRIQHGTARVADQIAEVPIRMHSNAARARVTARGVIEFLRGDWCWNNKWIRK
jgi:hypothetical protein